MKIEIIDPGVDCIGWHGRPTTAECSLASDCGGHPTGKLTAVQVGGWDGEIYYSVSESAARRRAQRMARAHGVRVEKIDRG